MSAMPQNVVLIVLKCLPLSEMPKHQRTEGMPPLPVCPIIAVDTRKCFMVVGTIPPPGFTVMNLTMLPTILLGPAALHLILLILLALLMPGTLLKICLW
jgi:hypothetical protein